MKAPETLGLRLVLGDDTGAEAAVELDTRLVVSGDVKVTTLRLDLLLDADTLEELTRQLHLVAYDISCGAEQREVIGHRTVYTLKRVELVDQTRSQRHA